MMVENEELKILTVTAEEAKRAIAAYSSQSNEVLAQLYVKFARFKDQYWPEAGLPDAIIAVMPEMNNKRLAHYQPRNGYQIPHALEFNYNFIALNWSDEKVVEQPDRTIIDHVLLHEMIHLFQDAVLGETHPTQKAAHGRSFRREAERLGVEGKGRLMSCPYEVKMLPNPNKSKTKKVQDDEPGDEQDGQTNEPTTGSGKRSLQSNNKTARLSVDELFEQLEERAAESLDDDGFENFYRQLKAAKNLLRGLPRPK